MKSDKIVYVAMAADILHPGHINILKKASELGKVTVGLLTDQAIAVYKRVPILKFEDRKQLIESIKGVEQVITQHSLDYTENLQKLRPDFVVHGDDWKKDSRVTTRDAVIETLKEWGGQLIEPSSTQGYSATQLLKEYLDLGITSDIRRKRLREYLELKPIIRVLEVHNGISARIVETTTLESERGVKEFDAMWLSSLTDSTAKGKPDTQCVDFTSRAHTIDQIFDVTTKPLIFDGDNGGPIEQFRFMVKTLERIGVSAIIIEDKIGVKRNSLFGNEVQQTQDTIEDFSLKIFEGKRTQVTEDFMIIARIESLIVGSGMDDALARAKAYINAGADGIMIHSKSKEPNEILDFCKKYQSFNIKVPLVAVPSTYNKITESELYAAGVSIVIYANQLLRSAFPAMQHTAELILKNERSFEANEFCMPIKEIITLIPDNS